MLTFRQLINFFISFFLYIARFPRFHSRVKNKSLEIKILTHTKSFTFYVYYEIYYFSRPYILNFFIIFNFIAPVQLTCNEHNNILTCILKILFITIKLEHLIIIRVCTSIIKLGHFENTRKNIFHNLRSN